MSVEPTTKDKQITIDVPEDRVAEFYAFYGRWLAGFPGRRRRGGHGHGPGPRGHRCGPRREEQQPQPEQAASQQDIAEA